MNLWLYSSAVVATLAAAAHSYIGEAKLFRPLFAETNHVGVMKSISWQRVTRGVWHIASICWMLMAAMTIALAEQNPTPVVPLYFASAVYLLSGLGNVVATRGKHFGWIVLLMAAALLWIGLRT